ncbi:hypothetical protein A3I57_03135 [Candidatus Beckwithbacteria bacterium RIFCSPLOWO2_02_FULL_47_23]|uniref:Uncharacterized protein n=1 Tax=Candidatus Beckwithbacteria bacterium RIFCSPLOWO2_02_FULL_47_23 TaxID=1797463 RepID=A0A1F5E2E6_9BACT|nr:MAG: hypothetical protein A3I57_03135 [Candidatus Beckwithbacteria bacterium RIFCSPLOWO2_02_FULL_47_23]
MGEFTQPAENRFGKEWVSFGDQPGLKTQGLIDLEQKKMAGIKVLPGISIGASFYFEARKKGTEDSILTQVNQEILSFLSVGKPVAVRSSATDESGGTGIYYTSFFVPSGNSEQDLKTLSQMQENVYWNFEAELVNRESFGKTAGMGILIQPLAGDVFNDHFMPVLSGVITLVNDEPALRLVIGLGTRAVDTSEALIFKRERVFDPKLILTALNTLREADAINLKTEGLDTIKITQEIRARTLSQLPKLNQLVNSWQETLSPENGHYWEFAINEQSPEAFIVQNAKEKRRPAKETELGPLEGKVLFEGTDVVNTGTRKGRGIIFAGAGRGFYIKDLEIVARLNHQFKGFLLILPDVFFSQVAGRPAVELTHFSNAAAVIEIQRKREKPQFFGLQPTVDHTRGRGGDHFTQLTNSRDILFLGVAPNDYDPEPEDILGPLSAKKGSFIGIWDVDFKVVNTPKEGRVELLSEVVVPEHSFKEPELTHWQSEMGDLGYSLLESKEFLEAGEALLQMSEAMRHILNQPHLGFEAFAGIDRLQKEQIESLQKAINVVLKNIYMLGSYDDFIRLEKHYVPEADFPLEEYLKEFLKRLSTTTKNR